MANPRPIIVRAFLVMAMCSAAGVAPAGGQSDKSGAPRVYIFTAQTPSGTPTEEELGRIDSVRDLREALRKNRKIVLVTDGSDAPVHVEVVGREQRDVGGGGFGGTTITKPVETIVRLHVTFGTREGEIKGVGQATWGRAAKDAAERLVKWITR